MAWYDYLNPANWGTSDDRLRGSQYGDIDPGGRMGDQVTGAQSFGQVGEAGFHNMGAKMDATEDMWRRRAMGEDSLSAEQLRQGLQQNLAAQRSMAAGGRGGDQLARMRQASLNAANLGAGLSGQQAMAGIAERQGALQGLSGMQQNRRQQELQAALQSRQTAVQGQGALVNAGTSRYGADMGVPSVTENILSGLTTAATAAAMPSDRRAKTDIRSGDDEAQLLLEGLRRMSQAPGKNDVRPVDFKQALRNAFLDGKVQGAGLGGAKYTTIPGERAEGSVPRRVHVGGGQHETVRQPLPREKTEADRMLDGLKAYSFRYKNPAKHGDGRRVGVMAQDLEKSPMGRRMVTKQADGMRAVNIDEGALLAGLAAMNDRLNKVEKKGR